MMNAEIDIWCACGAYWGFMDFNCEGRPQIHACPRCGEIVTATINVQYDAIPEGVSAEGASWAMEGAR